LAGRKTQIRRFPNGVVMKDEPVNHDAILANARNPLLSSIARQLGQRRIRPLS
jgi:hypothetical protein